MELGEDALGDLGFVGISMDPNMGVSKNSGTPKWMRFIMENPIKMDG